ncbi:MAG: DNA helicase RecQ [Bacteroidetes bacterium]|nr:DNA helicase RecQ [Bacteroidota bacterium]
MNIETSIREHLKINFGFSTFKGNQEKIIINLMKGNDTFVLMPTGGGKSLCYQLPALIMEGVAIVISPLIALMKNQVDAMRAHANDESVVHFINSSLNKASLTKVHADVRSGRTKLLYFAPESLTKEENINLLKSLKISFYAIDEAHCISEWGHDFRPEYRRIRPIIAEIAPAPIIALTATATPKVQLDIQRNLGMEDANVYKSSFNRGNLYYEVRPKVNPTTEIIKYIKHNSGKSGIIYCLSRKKVEEVANALQVNGISALAYHAGMDATQRATNQDRFLKEDVDVIVATIAFGMGIDKPDVRFVIHYDMPKSLEGYYQETGRAGRDGGEGVCITFYSYKDIQKLEKFMQGKPISEQEIGKLLIQETTAYAESSTCRRKMLLHYFGEPYNEEDCHNCDNCLHPKESFEGKDYIVKALTTLKEIGGRFKIDYLINIIIGKPTELIKSYKHDKAENFGIGKEKDSKFWNTVIRKALINLFIDKDIESYGLLTINDLGKIYIENPTSIKISLDNEYPETTGDDCTMSSHRGGASDENLLKMLKDLRKKVAKEHDLPPYVIFQEPSLDDMATMYPITMEELCNVSGVGKGKAHKFGAEFLEFIKKYVEENEISRPQDMVVKSVVNKSENKVYIIKSIDRKMDLRDIAAAKHISMEDLLSEIKVIVNSGTKLDINYYINEVMDEDKIDDIYDYFKEDAESYSLKDASDELGSDYTDEEIRLVKIKFISEVGN